MSKQTKRGAAWAGVVAVVVSAVVLAGANRPRRTVTVAPGTLASRLVARAMVVAEQGVARVGAPAGHVEEVRARVGDAVKDGTVVAVVLTRAGERHEVKAPQGGTVVRVHAVAGDDFGGTTPLLEMARLDRLEVLLEVDAADARRVAVGQDVLVRRLGGGEPLVTGRIARVAPTVGQRRIGASDARARAEGLVVAAWVPVGVDNDLILGEELEAALTLPELEAAAVVPHEAIRIEEGHAVVETPGRLLARERRVQLGRSDDRYVEVRDLAPGTTVLLPSP
jgi:multidrug efflux pump subunit AcrA (membrane-fusion protein)